MKDIQKQKIIGRNRRIKRTRAKILGTSIRPRAAIFRSLKHMAVQLIDDSKGVTVCSASDLEMKTAKKMNKQSVAKEVGLLLSAKAKKLKITNIVFDRRSYQYHGRVKALADGMRAGGLQF